MTMDERPNDIVYEAHAQELVRFASGLVGPDDAPDVVMDAFVRLTASAVWGQANDCRALWYRAVVYEARSWKRSMARRRVRELTVATSDRSAGEPPERDERVVAALNALSVQQRAVVLLTYWADLAPDAVAERLGTSEGTVRKQLARARKKLRGELDHE